MYNSNKAEASRETDEEQTLSIDQVLLAGTGSQTDAQNEPLATQHADPGAAPTATADASQFYGLTNTNSLDQTSTVFPLNSPLDLFLASNTNPSKIKVEPTKEFLALQEQKRAIDQAEANSQQLSLVTNPYTVHPFLLQQLATGAIEPTVSLPSVEAALPVQTEQNSQMHPGLQSEDNNLSQMFPLNERDGTNSMTDPGHPHNRRLMLGSSVQPMSRGGRLMTKGIEDGKHKKQPYESTSAFDIALAGDDDIGVSFSSPFPEAQWKESSLCDDPALWTANNTVEQRLPSTSSFATTPILPCPPDNPASPAKIPIEQNPWPASVSQLLPSTMIPPSVLAGTYQPARIPPQKRAKATVLVTETPQQVLERILVARGYGDKLRISKDASGYEAAPTGLQLASFGTEVVKAAHQSNTAKLSDLLRAGLSPNPCNQFRDSVLDLVCKRGNSAVFHCLLDHGANLRVCDSFGRTPLHHCCWGGELCESIAVTIMKRDWQQILMEDKRGQTPLEYVNENLAVAAEWISFLEAHQEELFPLDRQPLRQANRPLVGLPNPQNTIPLRLAAALAAGEMKPGDAKLNRDA